MGWMGWQRRRQVGHPRSGTASHREDYNVARFDRPALSSAGARTFQAIPALASHLKSSHL
jgi:hypothetical protein